METEAPTDAGKVFHPGLEGLRGVSVFAVLLFHANPAWLPGGFLGVSTFFTLSGFLITGLLVREWNQTQAISLASFWGRRLRRLLPASLLALFAIAVAAGLRADAVELEGLLDDGLSALFYVSNWWLIASGAAYDNLMGSPSSVQHFWSLSIEEQYYFAYPLVALGIFRLSGGASRAFAGFLAAASLASFGWMFWLSTGEASTARLYYGTDTRAGELLVGGVLAVVLAWRSANATLAPVFVNVVGLLGIAVTAVGWWIGDVDSNALYRGGLVVYAASTVALIWAAIQPAGVVRSLLSFSPIRWLGRISYGAYVYHWPIFIGFDDNWVRVPLTLVVAELSHRFFEEPVRSGRAFAGPMRLAAAPVAIACVAAAFIYFAPASFMPGDASTTADLQTQATRKLRIGVAGDSIARDVAAGLGGWGTRKRTAEVMSVAGPGCGIARGAWGNKAGRTEAGCDRWPSRARKTFRPFKPDVVVVATAGWDIRERRHPDWGETKTIGDPVFDEWLVDEYVFTADLFTKLGAKKVVWLTTPCYISRAGHTDGTWDPARQRQMNEYVLPALAARRPQTVSIIDLDAEVCPGGEYQNSMFGIKSFRPDGIHFSNAGKVWLGKWLGEELARRFASELRSGSAR